MGAAGAGKDNASQGKKGAIPAVHRSTTESSKVVLHIFRMGRSTYKAEIDDEGETMIDTNNRMIEIR